MNRAFGMLLVALASEGCVSVGHLYEGAALPYDRVALIATSLKQYSGMNTVKVVLESVDGRPVDSDNHDRIAVLPGHHVFEFSLSKIIDSGLSPITFTYIIFPGDELPRQEPPDRLIASTKNETVGMAVDAGLRYEITCRENLRFASRFDVDIVRGSWTPGLRALR